VRSRISSTQWATRRSESHQAVLICVRLLYQAIFANVARKTGVRDRNSFVSLERIAWRAFQQPLLDASVASTHVLPDAASCWIELVSIWTDGALPNAFISYSVYRPCKIVAKIPHSATCSLVSSTVAKFEGPGPGCIKASSLTILAVTSIDRT